MNYPGVNRILRRVFDARCSPPPAIYQPGSAPVPFSHEPDHPNSPVCFILFHPVFLSLLLSPSPVCLSVYPEYVLLFTLVHRPICSSSLSPNHFSPRIISLLAVNQSSSHLCIPQLSSCFIHLGWGGGGDCLNEFQCHLFVMESCVSLRVHVPQLLESFFLQVCRQRKRELVKLPMCCLCAPIVSIYIDGWWAVQLPVGRAQITKLLEN